MAGEPSVLLRPEIYITCALLGSSIFIVVYFFGVPLYAASAAGFLTAFCVRSGALIFGWTFPPYKGKPGRRPEDVMK
jgi:uncharacterized membrane protein YeiH